MSVDEDNELRELVSQTLETTGVLAKIRAELRASVFLALEEQDAFKDKQSLLNKALKEFVSTTEGAIVICLVREFLEFFGLEFTMAVFDPETQLGQDYEYSGRSKLANELKIKAVKKMPLLAQVVQNVCNSTINDDQDDSSVWNDSISKMESRKMAEEKANEIPPGSGNAVLRNDTVGSSKIIINKIINGSVKQETAKEISTLKQTEAKQILQTQQNSVPQPSIGIRKPDSLKLDLTNQPNSKSANSSLSSLGGLPPLAPMGNRQVGKTLISQKDMTNDIKAVLDLGLTDMPDNYEEDFHSTISEKTKKGGQISASGSEIEEEISSVGDDQTSISGAGDEVTVDTSISQESGQGDYEENV